MILGSLAIIDDDTSGVARQLLEAAVANAAVNCVNATMKDGSWSETANYWYCGLSFALLANFFNSFSLAQSERPDTPKQPLHS